MEMFSLCGAHLNLYIYLPQAFYLSQRPCLYQMANLMTFSGIYDFEQNSRVCYYRTFIVDRFEITQTICSKVQ